MTTPGTPQDPFAPPSSQPPVGGAPAQGSPFAPPGDAGGWGGAGPAGGWSSGPAGGWSGGPRPDAQTESKAVVALVSAIAAYTPIVPFLGAIAALVLAHYARRDIRRSDGALKGEGLCRAAVVLAWVHLVFVGLALVVVLVLLAVGVGISLLGVTLGG